MCGFVALIRKRKSGIDPDVLRKMNDKIVHRGPDAEGYFYNQWLGLGFRRLSIIDLTTYGNQPMFDLKKRFVCVFNGEIFNYIELREELIRQGVTFLGRSDTEVLLQSYIHWGADCVHRFIGMFAFIIADLEQKKIYIARDFPGIKPLYFTEDSNFYYFASEIKAFSKVIPLVANSDCYYESFKFRYLAGDRTHFKNVIKVLPGSYWTINLEPKNTINKYTYFDLKKTFLEDPLKNDINNIILETKKMLNDSFVLHTRSDVGYSLQLSGGVDSSYLTSVLSQSNQCLNTFSIELQGAHFDESFFQKEVVQRCGTQHHGIYMQAADYAMQLERATYHMEAPIVHSGCVFLMELCRHIREVSKVVLTGEGADELFGGYWRHKPNFLQNIIFQLQKYKINLNWLPDLYKFKTLKKLLNEHLILNTHRQQEDHYFNLFFNSDLVHNSQRLAYAHLINTNYINSILIYDQLTYISSVLDRQDKLSMSYSIEARVPYCHQKLYSYVNSIPAHFKMYGGERKSILKQCALSYLPHTLVYRRKNGLRLPLFSWYRDKNTLGYFVNLLNDHKTRQRGIYNYQFMNKALIDFKKGNNHYAKSIITLAHLELWHRIFNL